MKNRKRLQQWKAGLLLFLSVWICAAGMSLAPAPAYAAGAITLDTPADGATVSGNTLHIAGTYTDAYGVKLYINGERQVNAVMDDPDGNDAGTWQYDLDISGYNGAIQINAMATDNVTRYGVWSKTITVNVQNPGAGKPNVTIISPADGQTVSGVVPVRLNVASGSPIGGVQVRINGGPWQNAAWNGTEYRYDWNTAGLGDKTNSIEARATDDLGRTGRSLTTYASTGAGTHEPFFMKRQDRAMWIWESESYKLLLNPGSRTVLDAFAKDTATFGSDPVTTFYMAVGPFSGMNILEDDPGKLRDFIRWAHGQGYQVYACIAGGTTPPYLGAYEAYHEEAIREIEGIINYNIASGAGEKFDGVNVDIEPYISPDFKDQYPSLQLQYLDGLRKMIGRRDKAGINLPFGPAIPKWYDTSAQSANITWNGTTKWLSEHVQDISDYISIMDYRDTADGSAGITAGGQGEIAYADAIGKPNSVVLGVETLDIANSGDPETITFREEGRTVMEAELDKVYAAFAGNASFGGIAMHHYDSIRTLPSYWGPGSVVWSSPADTQPPTAVSSGPSASAASYQQINLTYGMAYDDTDIDRYIVYRSTVSGFTPSPGLVAGMARGQSFSDIGLLPNTTYYYRVAAKDLKGNIGPASPEISAATSGTTLKPVILTDMQVSYTGTNAAVSMRAVDPATELSVGGAKIEGRFTYSGGRYTSGTADMDGRITLSSEAIPSGRQVGFEPRRVTASGYYWAQAYDRPHTAALYPSSGLSGLAVSAGSLTPSFDTNTTKYSVAVPGTTASMTVTPTAKVSGSSITVNGQPVPSGQASQPIPLAVGDNFVTVLVTGPDGIVDTYSVTATRSAPMNNEFQAVEDTYVYENNPGANYGTAAALEVVDAPRAAGGGDKMSYLKFDFAGYADPVQSAVLRLYVPTAPSAQLAVNVAGTDGDGWSETGMTWSNRPGAGFQTVGTLNVKAAGWYSLDVTDFVKNQLALDKKATFRLMDPNTKNILVSFGSRESTSFAPTLTITPVPDTTPPATSAAIDGERRGDWYVTDARVTLAAADASSGVERTEYKLDGDSEWRTYTAPIMLEADGLHKLVYRSVDREGNEEAEQSVVIPIDKTAPAVTVAGAGRYAIDETVLVTCTASDTVSGVTYSSCGSPLVSAPAYELGVGTHEVAVQAEDAAGNIVSRTASFTIEATIPGLANLLREWLAGPEEAGLAQSLIVKLNRGRFDAFAHEVLALKGNKLSEERADLLIEFVGGLK